jgi:hypothetical protein
VNPHTCNHKEAETNLSQPQRAALIHRCFISHKISNLIRAYKTYVRPLVEYATHVWSPYQINLINMLEGVQRAFTKRLPGFSNLSYEDRLTKLQLQSLEHRRLLFDLTMCFNIIHGFTALNFDDFFIFSKTTSTRGHQFKLVIPLDRTNLRKFFFSSRVIPIWNSLPPHCVCATSTSNFKKRISNHDFSPFLNFPCFLPKP